jgi:hypothetical protein
MINGIERIILFIYFPQFNRPSNSRFESFFRTISKDDSSSKKKKRNKSRTICPEKIVRNEDKRTSIIIKGIPTDMPKKEVRALIEKYGNLNYLYITKDLNGDGEKETSIAFINVINYKTIIPLFMNMRNYQFNCNGEMYNIKLMYASVQGKKQLKQYIKNAYFCQNFE